jgi:hypothetical protein
MSSEPNGDAEPQGPGDSSSNEPPPIIGHTSSMSKVAPEELLNATTLSPDHLASFGIFSPPTGQGAGKGNTCARYCCPFYCCGKAPPSPTEYDINANGAIHDTKEGKRIKARIKKDAGRFVTLWDGRIIE